MNLVETFSNETKIVDIIFIISIANMLVRRYHSSYTLFKSYLNKNIFLLFIILLFHLF